MPEMSGHSPGSRFRDFINRPETFVRFSLILWILTLITMILGPYVRAEDAGLACPDWPLCFGHVIPPYEYRVYLEFIHRVVAAFMSLIFLVWLVMIAVLHRLREKYLIPAVIALVVLALQIGLGGATVTEHLNAYIVKFHLMNALVFLGILLFIWRHAYLHSGRTAGQQASWLLQVIQAVMVLAILAQIYLGGRVSTNYAGLACTGFPECYSVPSESPDEKWDHVYFPPMKGHWEKHMTHRFGAYILFLFTVYAWWVSRKTFAAKKNAAIVALMLWQMTLGVINILFNLPVIAQVLHSATAMILYIIAMIQFIDTRFRGRETGLSAA